MAVPNAKAAVASLKAIIAETARQTSVASILFIDFYLYFIVIGFITIIYFDYSNK